jgi:2-keto-4-pentenoate hydratase/2-oxohepta-3-ene-1,7-dioic acid hydratase in catechol pathway
MTLKFARLGAAGNEQPVVIAQDAGGDKYFSLASLTKDIDGVFLASDGMARSREALEAGQLEEISAEGLRIGAPVARPSNVIAIGLNYAAHAAESGVAPPEVPVVFLKPANTISGPFDAAPIPPSSEKYDWEVELAIVIGKEASYLSSVEEAAEYIAGYSIANDLSERDFQMNGPAGQWTKGKTLPGSTPLGPWLVPASDVDASNLGLRTRVNGEIRQDSNTSDMVFDAPTIVHHLSQYMVLEAGDVIITGTPEGVALSGRFPFIQPGDVIELEIDGLGVQRQEYYRAGTGKRAGASLSSTSA